MLVFVMDMNNMPNRCGELPLPDDPKLIWPGCALASAMSCFTDFTGSDGCTTTTQGASPTRVTAAKSVKGS